MIPGWRVNMAFIFNNSHTGASNAGSVAVIHNNGRAFGNPEWQEIQISDWQHSSAINAVLTRLDYSHAINAQFTPTLSDRIYLYSFGVRPMPATLSGIAFTSVCSNQRINVTTTETLVGAVSNNTNYWNKDRSGIHYVEAFFSANNVNVRPDPLIITIGGLSQLYAYLVGLSGTRDVINGEDFFQFTLNLQVLPNLDIEQNPWYNIFL